MANDPITALDLVRAQPQSVVLVDLLMPRMDGLSFIEACRALRGCRGVPIILITAHAKHLVDSREQLEGQRVLIVLKPFELDALLDAVRELLRNWVRQVDIDVGRRHHGLTTSEREELGHLPAENGRRTRPSDLGSCAAQQPITWARPSRLARLACT